MITTVLLVDNPPAGRLNVGALNLDKRTTLVVCDPEVLEGFGLADHVPVVDRTLHMPLRRYKAIQDQLARCRAKAGRGLNDASIAECAAKLATVVEDRLQDALHCGEPAALLTAALLGELAEQVVDARNCRYNAATLTALAERVVVDLPEPIRTYRRHTTTV